MSFEAATTPSFNLDPIAIPLISDLTVEIEKGTNSKVFTHDELYQLLI